MPYDNESGRWFLGERRWEMSNKALWLINDPEKEGVPRLYLIPPPDITAEIEGGPDDGVLDALNALCRDHDFPTEEEISRLGLLEVPAFLRRFSPADGFYTA